ncbi:MAG: hypothetical protein IKZ53_00435 [Selenomonadaceae bacterium]|nr:hypothetical protein [Selenomonadaceae bacterium]
MRKVFLAGTLTVCLLFTGCGEDKNADTDTKSKLKTLDFQVNNTSGFQRQAVNCEGESIEAENQSVVNKSAMNQIDWSSAPTFNNQPDFIRYLRDCRIDLEETLPVVFTNGFKPDVNDAIKVVPTWYMEWTYKSLDSKTTAYLFEISEYPGERVAWAYKNGDNSFLNEDEMKLYNLAVKIVNDAKNFSNNLLWQELYIHDRITELATYYTEKPQPAYARFQTAIGALIDGKANCQGYTDAFYMLGNMCGIKVGKVNGYANNGMHTWNTVNFNDDRTYFTDVTWDDATFKFNDTGEYPTFAYFNASTDIAGTTHQWFADYVPQNLQQTPDGRDFYFTHEYFNSNEQYFGYHFDSAQSALDYIAKRIANGWRLSWMCAPYDSYYADYKNSLNYLLQSLTNLGWRGNVKIHVLNRGNKYLFITVDATPN